MQFLSPQQYYSNLSSNENLLEFSRKFITGTLPKYTQIFGSGNNGKTTLINMLTILARDNNITVHRGNSGYPTDCEDTIVIIEDDGLLTSEFYKRHFKTNNTKFVFIFNAEDWGHAVGDIIEMSVVTNPISIDFAQFNNKADYVKFIMNFDSDKQVTMMLFLPSNSQALISDLLKDYQISSNILGQYGSVLEIICKNSDEKLKLLEYCSTISGSDIKEKQCNVQACQ